MFFDDPVAAFANIRRALRPAGRLVMMVWQAHERNEWDVAIHRVARWTRRAAAVARRGTGSVLARRSAGRGRGSCEAAGFADIAFTDVHEPVYYGPDMAAALDWVRGFTCTSEA